MLTRRRPDSHTLRPKRRLDLHLAPIFGDRIESGGRSRGERDREHGLGGCFANRAHKVPIQGELSTWMHVFKFLHHGEDLVGQWTPHDTTTERHVESDSEALG